MALIYSDPWGAWACRGGSLIDMNPLGPDGRWPGDGIITAVTQRGR